MRLNLVLLLLLSLFACKQHGEVSLEQPNSVGDAHFVDKDAIKGLLSSIAGSVTTKSGSSCFANVTSVETVMDSVGNPVFYVINYDPSGFVIMAADNRVNPILAYSAVNSFDLASARSLGGIGDWLSGTEVYINDVRRIDTASYDSLAWSSARIAHIITRGAAAETGNWAPNVPGDKEEPNEDMNWCSQCKWFETLLPLTTKWHQTDGFDMATPWVDCGSYMDRAPAGCVAVAAGQVMKYYQHPAHYNWSLMHDTDATQTTAQLLRDIGDKFAMNYSCDGSGAYPSNAPHVLKTHFGYRSANFSDYNISTIKTEIMNHGRPVMMNGWKNSGAGHSWVVMGCMRYEYCDNHYFGMSGVSALYMNWGWGSSGKNGWYNPTGAMGYSNNIQIVFNIAP